MKILLKIKGIQHLAVKNAAARDCLLMEKCLKEQVNKTKQAKQNKTQNNTCSTIRI